MVTSSSGTPARRRALLSVSDKSGLVEFARRLVALDFELLSTGGTAQALRAAGLPVRDVAEVTGYPEMLDGRVKTLHPAIHGGLLGRRDNAAHRAQMEAQGIAPIEIVAVNLYPFEKVAARLGTSLEELIENIDIGGPSMLRSAAKNHEFVTAVTDPADYDEVAGELERSGVVGAETRARLARKVFARTAAYDGAIAAELATRASGEGGKANNEIGQEFPAQLGLQFRRVQALRYGENPHQRAALYADATGHGGVARAEALQGKELSFNNLVDLEAAWQLVNEFERPAVAIIKHTNPAGCAQAEKLVDAYQRALACDPVSAFGGIIGVNRPLDDVTAEAIAALFVECIAAPGYSPEALARLASKKNLRLVRIAGDGARGGWVLKSLSGGLLVQQADEPQAGDAAAGWRTVTKRQPTDQERADLQFVWRVTKHVKSNAIVFARDGQTLAVGAGQMSRVDSVKLAAMKAKLPLADSVVGSDAFFPFADGIEMAIQNGARAIIQPGGSVRDEEGIAACDRAGVAMVFTGVRHFRH